MDWAALTLLMMVMARMSGFVLFNPLFGRQNLPGIVKSGLVLVLSFTVYAMEPAPPPVPAGLLELVVRLLLELALGYVLGLVMHFFLSIPMVAGEVEDTQMGMSMGKTYDPSSQTSVTVTATMLNALAIMLFFAAGGHHTLLRILLTSGEVVPFGQAALGQQVFSAMARIFADCMFLAVKLCMPVLAAELLGQVGMGILMKVIPQINVFAINIELKVIIGLGLVMFLLMPFSEYILKFEADMLRWVQAMLTLMTA